MPETFFSDLMAKLQAVLTEVEDFDIEPTEVQPGDVFSLGFGEVELMLSEHPDEQHLMILAHVAPLKDPDPTALAERLLLLMKLNLLAPFGSGIQLGVDEDNVVTAFRMVNYALLATLDDVADTLLAMVESVDALQSAWDRLDTLMAATGDVVPGFEADRDAPDSKADIIVG